MRSWLSSLWHQVKKEADGLQYVFKPDLFRFDYRDWAHGIQDELRELLAKLLATQCVVRVEAKMLEPFTARSCSEGVGIPWWMKDDEPFLRFAFWGLLTRPALQVVCEVSDGLKGSRKPENSGRTDSAHHEDLANVGRRPFSLSEQLPNLVRNRAVRKTGIAVCLVGAPILFQIF
jgi:hypothetical protein